VQTSSAPQLNRDFASTVVIVSQRGEAELQELHWRPTA